MLLNLPIVGQQDQSNQPQAAWQTMNRKTHTVRPCDILGLPLLLADRTAWRDGFLSYVSMISLGTEEEEAYHGHLRRKQLASHV
jgi:hypothetical protein